MSRQPLLFESLPRSRPRQVLMHVVDAGHCHGDIVRLECAKCGHDSGWVYEEPGDRRRGGRPCPVCNAGETER